MIDTFEKYLNKYSEYLPLIDETPHNNLGLSVIIPAYNEPQIEKTLQSILQTDKITFPVEVIIVINHKSSTPDFVKKQNIKTFKELIIWSKNNSCEEFKFHILFFDDFPEKHAGVGLARKKGMDEAVCRFSQIKNLNGIIVSLDADTTISKNYLIELEKEFSKNKRLNVIIPNFRHSLHGLSEKEQKAITEYELYLRYFQMGLKYTGFPYAYQTIGSAFAVRAEAYVKQGGMNKKQGGEDFYFLHKIFQLGNNLELKTVTVYPSGRVSDRVPFGTGPAVKSIIEHGNWQTYNPILFTYLKHFFSQIPLLFNVKDKHNIFTIYTNIDKSIQAFISLSEFEKKITEINSNSKSISTFNSRFFNWFNAFKIIKYLNSTQQSIGGQIDVNQAINAFCDIINSYKST